MKKSQKRQFAFLFNTTVKSFQDLKNLYPSMYWRGNKIIKKEAA